MYKLKIAIKYRIWYEISKIMQNLWFKCVEKRGEYRMLWIRIKIAEKERKNLDISTN